MKIVDEFSEQQNVIGFFCYVANRLYCNYTIEIDGFFFVSVVGGINIWDYVYTNFYPTIL